MNAFFGRLMMDRRGVCQFITGGVQVVVQLYVLNCILAIIMSVPCNTVITIWILIIIYSNIDS